MTPEQREYVIETLERYWPKNKQLIENLPIAIHKIPENEELPPQGVMVNIPDWASDYAVDGCLLVPRWASEQTSKSWNQIDWIAVCFWYLNNLAERAHEDMHGPIHSYSLRLKDWDKRLWERAWVNRIALFLRKWAAQDEGQSEELLFGHLPEPEILITHDVDAITKTIAIRFKQTIFHGFNALRLLMKGQFEHSVKRGIKAFRFLFSRDDYWCFDEILELEKKSEIKTIFNFYGGKPGKLRNFKEQILDPAYDVHDPVLKGQIKKMHKDGWSIGLHQSFDAWKDKERMKKEKENLESALGYTVITCRQHWLRFSFKDTWKTQQAVGFKQDTTLGFNDRPAFRNAAAVNYFPWDKKSDKPMQIEVIPMMLMDSHIYDYAHIDEKNIFNEIDKWINEVKFVFGKISVIWHQRVMSDDYGWGPGYTNMLEIINKKGN